MPLPNTVLTFKLLDDAKLSGYERKLALILGNNLELETMKSTIANKPFHDNTNIKQEKTLYSKNMYQLMQNKTSKSFKFQRVLNSINSNNHNPRDKNGSLLCIMRFKDALG